MSNISAVIIEAIPPQKNSTQTLPFAKIAQNLSLCFLSLRRSHLYASVFSYKLI